jgi:hypothetical protein
VKSLKEALVIPEKYIISYKNQTKINWDIFILLLAFQNSLLIPVEMAFDPPFTKDATFIFFNNIIDFMFFIDMCWMFCTSHLNQKGQEIFDSLMIAQNYVKSIRFLFDFFAILGTRLVTNKFPNLKIFGIFKMSRILRLG